MMMTVIAAALAATAQPGTVPADAHAQHARMQQGQTAPMNPQQRDAMKAECCCKEKMEKMRSGQDHQEHGGR